MLNRAYGTGAVAVAAGASCSCEISQNETALRSPLDNKSVTAGVLFVVVSLLPDSRRVDAHLRDKDNWTASENSTLTYRCWTKKDPKYRAQPLDRYTWTEKRHLHQDSMSLGRSYEVAASWWSIILV